MNPGDIVNPKLRATSSGFPIGVGAAKLLAKVGTVPNFWKYLCLQAPYAGKIMDGFVYEEDLVKSFLRIVPNATGEKVSESTEKGEGPV